MSELKTVKVAGGRRVVTPTGATVPAGGFQVDPRDPWWARALASGDVVELTEAELAALKAAADKAEAERKAAAEKAKVAQPTNDQGKTAAAVSSGGTAGAGETK